MSELSPSAFVGREALLRELHQFLSAPATYALSIHSAEGLGKSSLLRRVAALDPSFVSVLMPITQHALTSVEAWLAALADATLKALHHADLATARLPSAVDADAPRWLSQVFLPAVGQHVRQHARVIWLLDDIHTMGAAIREGRFPADHPAYLLELALAFPFLSIVTSADEDSPDLAALHPLVQPHHVIRLGPLGRLEVEQLLRQQLSYVPPALAERAYAETGGMPHAINDLVAAIQRGEAPDDAVEHAYFRSQAGMRRRWDRLTRDERIVLTALIELRHANPERDVTPNALELWLAHSDHPMDATSIAAQLRSLEFRHWLRPQRQPIRLRSGLMERWLLEHARQEAPAAVPSRRWGVFVGLLGMALAALLVAFFIASLPPAATVTEAPLPTLTLGAAN